MKFHKSLTMFTLLATSGMISAVYGEEDSAKGSASVDGNVGWRGRWKHLCDRMPPFRACCADAKECAKYPWV